jgi:hypothetical protein
MFGLAPNADTGLVLEPQEAFVLTRLSEAPLTISEIISRSGLEEKEVLKILYTLWFAGMLTRKEWNPAFSEFRIRRIQTADLKLAKPAADIVRQRPVWNPKHRHPPSWKKKNRNPR